MQTGFLGLTCFRAELAKVEIREARESIFDFSTDQFLVDLVDDVCVVHSPAVVFKLACHPQTRLLIVDRQEVVESGQ